MRAVLMSLLPLVSACVSEIVPVDAGDCDVFVDETFPAAGATDAFYRNPVEFRLSEPDPTAVVVSDVPGEQWTRDEGHVVVFQPDQPLHPDQAYTFGLDFCGGEPTIAFATSNVGAPLAIDVDDLEGTAWWLDLDSGRYLRGDALGMLLGTVFHDGMWIGIEDVSGGTMSLIVATSVASGEHQDYCLATVDLPKGSLVSAPWFEVQAADVGAWLGDTELPLSYVAVAGAFDATASRVEGITWRFVVDVRDLAVTLEQKDTEALCDLAEGTGAPCAPCVDGSPTCIVLEGDSFTARRVPGVEIERIAEPMTHPRCDP